MGRRLNFASILNAGPLLLAGTPVDSRCSYIATAALYVDTSWRNVLVANDWKESIDRVTGGDDGGASYERTGGGRGGGQTGGGGELYKLLAAGGEKSAP